MFFRKKKCLQLIGYILILTFLFGLVSGCGRLEKGGDSIVFPVEISVSDVETVGKNDVEETETITTAQAIKEKKLKQFEKANADLSVLRDGDIKNILIVGQDRRAFNKEEMRSDCMMIFSINLVKNEINLVSLMRDMYIPCADGREGMINMTYLNGGAKLLAETIEMNFGVHIDNYIETDFWRFMDLFEHIGPIDVEVTAEEAKIMNDMSNNHRVTYYDYGDEKPVWYIHVGVNSLDPEQMLSFCRIRKEIGGDWARTERQRRAITAVYNRLNDMSYAGLIRMIRENGHYLSTDMDIYDMLGYFYWLKKNNITHINSYRIPVDGTYSQEIREEVLQVLVPQIEPNRQSMRQYIYGY